MNSSVKNHSPGYFVGYLIAMLCAFMLTACGGGGGSPGSVPNQPTPTPTQSVASLVITTSSDTLSSSGAAGSEVTVTVLAKDKNNNAVSGATITLTANSGAVTFVLPSNSTTAVPGVTDASGTVTAKLSTAGVSTPRIISLAATSGTVSSATKTVTVVQSNAKLTIITSSDELPSSGSITVTVFAKDGSNNAIRGAKVNLSSNSGLVNVTTADGKTGIDGTIVATLTSPGDTTPRDLKLTATLDPVAGISDPAEKTIKVVTAVPTIQITSSSGILPSSGAAGTEVTINVLVRDAGNNVKSGVPVLLTADSGSLTLGARVSNAQGLVSEKLSVASNPANRTIKVTASADGVAPQSIYIGVTETTMTINAPTSVNAGAATEMTATLVDSSSTPLSNRQILVTTSSGGVVALDNNGITSSSGRVRFTYTPPATGETDVVSATALGATGTARVVINRANFRVTTPVDSNGVAVNGVIGSCYPVSIHSDNGGTPTTGSVALSISRGTIYSNSTCSTAQVASLNFDSSGNTSAYFSSPTPGTVALVATLPTNISVQGAFKFTAPLTPTANIAMSVDPSVIGTNLGTDRNQQAAVRAVVRDGTTGNNLVSGATVNFSIIQDNSGGSLSTPSVVVTGDDGIATVNYIAGPSSTATDGVIVQAQIQGTTITSTTRLTVGRRSLFMTAGTGNTIGTPNPQSYQVDYQVLVTDAAGNAVPGANITASILPTKYLKGFMIYNDTFWTPFSPISCDNEDLNKDGILNSGEDNNQNGRLEPGIPVAVTPTVQTNSSGIATVSLVYAREQANWLKANLSITASVVGSEAKYVASFVLPGLSTDYTRKEVSPPGLNSPYGTVTGLDPVTNRVGCQSPN